MTNTVVNMVMIPQEEWDACKKLLEEIASGLHEKKTPVPNVAGSNYIIAKDFMAAVKIKRSRFNKLINANKIKAIKKGRRIYVPVGEVDRYFTDKSIQ